MMNQKYLAEIKNRFELGRPTQQREVKALLAEVERLQSVVKIQRASCNLVEMAKAANIVDGIAAKDQQIATLKKALELACEEISDYALPSGTGRMKSVLITARIEKFMNHAKQVQEQEAEK